MAEFWLQTFAETAHIGFLTSGYIKTRVIAHEPPDAGVSPPLT